MWYTGRESSKRLQYSCQENPMNSMNTEKDMTPEVELPRLEDVQYATGKEQTALTNGSRKNEMAGPQWNTAHLWR